MRDERSADVTPAEPEIANARPTVDEMSEWSFPASDPPATWTWDPPVPRPRQPTDD
jgi:hypothetical protein